MTILETAVSLSNTGLVDGLSYHNFSLHSRFRSSAIDKGIEILRICEGHSLHLDAHYPG